MGEVGWCDNRDQWFDTITNHLTEHGYVVAVDVPEFAIDLSHTRLAPYKLSHLAQWQQVSVAAFGDLERILLQAIDEGKPVVVHGFIDYAVTLELHQITTVLTLIANCKPGYICDSWPQQYQVEGHPLHQILAKWVYSH